MTDKPGKDDEWREKLTPEQRAKFEQMMQQD